MAGDHGRGGTTAWWRIAIVVAAGGGFAAPATAAITGVGGLPSSAESGALAEPAGLHLNGSIEALYDSNVLRNGRGGAGLANGHIDDFRYSPEAEATYGRDTGRIALGVNALVGRDIFQYNSRLDRNQYRGGGSISYRAGANCQLVVDGNYVSRQNGIGGVDESLVDPANQPDDIGTVVDNVQSVSTYGANARCGSPAGRLTFSGGYSHTAFDNAAATRRFADSDGDTYTGSIGIGIFRPGQLSFNGSYSTIVYPGRTPGALGANVPPQLLNAGVRTYRLGLAFSRPIGTRLSGQIGASFLHAEPSGGVDPYSSPAYNIGLTYMASRRLTVALTGSRDIIASQSIGSLYRVIDSALLEGHYSFGRAITFNANAGFIHNDYKQSFATVGEAARLSQTSKTFGVGATYSPRRLYDLSINVTQVIRSSNPDIFNYSGTRAGLTLAVHI